MMWTLGFAALAAGLTAAIRYRPASAAPPRVEAVDAPDGGIQPQVAVEGGTVHLLYFKGPAANGDLFYVRRPVSGGEWSSPLRVNSTPGSAVATGTIRGGHLAVGQGGRIHVIWFGSRQAGVKAPDGGAPLLYARSTDAGAGFEPQRNLMRVSAALDGGGSVAADTTGNVWVAWHGGDGSAKGEEHRQLWVAHSSDAGKSFPPEAPGWKEPTGACACCSTKAFADRAGRLFVLYRSAGARVDRDIYLLTPGEKNLLRGTRLDRWKIAACPMSSESLVEGPDGVLAAWETAGQVSYASVGPDGLRGQVVGAPASGDNRKHPTLAVNAAGDVLMAWTEGTAWQRGGAVAWQVFDKAGRPQSDRGRIGNGVPVWGLVAAYARPDGTFVVVH